MPPLFGSFVILFLFMATFSILGTTLYRFQCVVCWCLCLPVCERGRGEGEGERGGREGVREGEEEGRREGGRER